MIEAAMAPPKAGANEQPLSLAFAIPDHPWVDATDGAAVRIAMTVGTRGSTQGKLSRVESERATSSSDVDVALSSNAGFIHADLRTGANVASARTLRANLGLSCPGLKLHGAGFIVSAATAVTLGLGSVPGLERYIRPYRNGRDLTDAPRGVLLIDLFGLEAEDVRARFPAVYQHVLQQVKPERDANNRATYRDNWWIHGEPRGAFRPALAELPRYIATVETAKHRTFQFLDAGIAPDNMVIAIASDAGENLGVLSSAIHVVWALSAGGRLGIGNDPRYNKSRCFDPFPFPAGSSQHNDRIRTLAEHLDAHRKRQQAAHPDLTLTGMYNVLDKLRSGEPLTAKERTIHEHGLVSVLRQLHDDLDAAVLDAYGWSDLLPLLRIAHGNDTPTEGQSRDEARRAFDETILERLVALNAERAAEEARGVIRWLRPDFQNPAAQSTPHQAELGTAIEDENGQVPVIIARPQPWPKGTVEQVRALVEVIAGGPAPLSLEQIGSRFTARGPWKRRLPHLLEMLVATGRVHADAGLYRARP